MLPYIAVMNRESLKEEVRKTLARTGFYVSDISNTYTISFDIVSRRDNLLLIIKVLVNVDSFNRETAQELKVLAEFLEASPLLVGERGGGGKLEQGIVYLRYGIPMMSKETLEDFFIEGIPPYVFTARGGYYSRIDENAIKKLRAENEVSLGALAKAIGVSRKAIQMYEQGMCPNVDIAIKLEKYFNKEIILPINPFSYSHEKVEITKDLKELDKLEKEVFIRLDDLGYDVVVTKKCPFNALTKEKEILIFTGVGKYEKKLKEKARVISEISSIAERYKVLFVKHSKKKNIEGTPLISTDELERTRDTEEIFNMICEREKKVKK